MSVSVIIWDSQPVRQVFKKKLLELHSKTFQKKAFKRIKKAKKAREDVWTRMAPPQPLCCLTWSPMLRWPHLAAGPVGHRLASTMVGSMEPQPLSTITTPSFSLTAFGMTTCTIEIVSDYFMNNGTRTEFIMIFLIENSHSRDRVHPR